MRPVLSLRTCGGDQVVGSPAVADLTGHVVAIAALLPVHLVGGDAGGVVAVEEGGEALAEDLDGGRRDEPLLDDEEAVAAEALDLLVGDVFERNWLSVTVATIRYQRVTDLGKQPLESLPGRGRGGDAGPGRRQLGGGRRGTRGGAR